MKKSIFISAIIISLTTIFASPSLATGGALKGDSICTKDGVTYGRHGDGHWHKAVKKSGRWYPDGGSLGTKNPCT